MNKLEKQVVESKKLKASDVLVMLGIGSLVGASFIVPGMAKLAFPVLCDYRKRKEGKEDNLFNSWQLRRNLRLLQKRKHVNIEEGGGATTVTITELGKREILRYQLNQLVIKRSVTWDHYWRVIIYDVAELKKARRERFRLFLQNLGFLAIQDSVYLIPYPCEDEIKFLREYFGIGEAILYMVVQELENDLPYRRYFDLN